MAAKYKIAGLQLDGTYQKRNGVTDRAVATTSNAGYVGESEAVAVTVL